LQKRHVKRANFNRVFPKLHMEHLFGSCTEPFDNIICILLRLRSSCPCWNTGRRVVSIQQDHWQRSWLHECHCHWHSFLASLLYMYPATPALSCPIFCFLPLESNLSPDWLVV